MIHEKILNEYQKNEKQIQTLKQQLKTFPEGKLVCTKNGKYSKWYRSDGSTYDYIPKQKRQLAEKLAHKKYLSFQLQALLNEQEALSSYLKHHHNTTQDELSFVNSPEYMNLISSYFTPVSQEFTNWMNSTYETNQKHPETLIHKTLSGKYVRSKSEVLIDMFLYKNKIPFRYESLLQLDEIALFLDFTIRHPESGEFYYWEHFGFMDDPAYVKNTCSKLQLYASHGFIPSINLITTYETKEKPLTADMVEKIVNYYFLDK